MMEGEDQKDRTGHRDAVAERVAAMIRERSAARQLMTESEILRSLNDADLMPLDTDQPDEEMAVMLAGLVQKNEDLHQLSGTGPPCYYSCRHMTEAYAKILHHKLYGPMRLIAETVRQNACEYGRPVPLELFTEPPFHIAHQELLDVLSLMSKTSGYGDMATTETSASGIYLYSTLHMEADHAVMLAEWLDVGQSQNP